MCVEANSWLKFTQARIALVSGVAAAHPCECDGGLQLNVMVVYNSCFYFSTILDDLDFFGIQFWN